MNCFKRLFLLMTVAVSSGTVLAQFNDSGISAGFFDSSGEKSINFSEFHLPPLSVLFENAKATPRILTLAKAQEIAEAEVAKQRRHIFSYIHGHASYSYGKTDMWGNNSSTYTTMIYQFQGNEQSYWNVGVSLAVPLEDILDLGAAVKRKKLEVDQAVYAKDLAYDELKLQIASLFVKITNNLVALKGASENAAMYQGAGALNLEDFYNGNMNIEDFAWTKTHEDAAISNYQALQTEITTDIMTLEIISHTPILTNTTTEITLDSAVKKSEKEVERENAAVMKRVKKAAQEEQKKIEALEKAEQKAKKAEQKAATKKK
jgi:hypothetical protein